MTTSRARAIFLSCSLLVLVTVSPAVAQDRPRTQPQALAQMPEGALEPQGLIAEPGTIERVTIWFDRHFGEPEMTNGFYSDFWNMVPGAGWISAGPGYRRWMKKDAMFFDTSAAISWRGFKTAQARFEMPKLLKSRLMLGTQARWQDFTQISYFGTGPDALEANVSEYRVKSSNLVGYAIFRPVEWVDVGGEMGVLSPSILPRGGSFKRDRPDTATLYPGDIVYAVAEQPTFVHSEASITADTRDFPAHPTRGAVVRGAVTHYADRDLGLFSHRQYQAEAAGFLPLAGSRVVLALRGWTVSSDAGDGRFVPFYLQPSLGGHNSLRAYADYRFHDNNLLLVSGEARVAMMTHVDAAVFVDAGTVAARFADLNLSKQSYGFGLRMHSRRRTFARLDVARGDEGWRMVFRLTEPFNLSHLTRRTATVPFVP